MQKTIFVVDDSLSNLSLAEEVLEKKYRVVTLSSAKKLFMALEKQIPDLILLDIAMPDMSGFDAIKQLKNNGAYAQIPVIFLTALTDSFNEALGIQLGAVDFITKPFSEPVLMNRIKNHILIEELIGEKTAQLTQLKNGIVFTMADIVESRDKNTGGHIKRLQHYLKVLLSAMTMQNAYADEISKWDIDAFISSADLHDLGKICVPDSILNKPGALTEQEFDTIKSHAAEGEKIISQMIGRTDETEFLHNAKLIAAHHHERWDGAGYPRALTETDIPLQGRIVALADAYDALVSERPYKKAVSHEEAVDTIMKDAGQHFDPLIAEVFYKVNDQFKL